MFASAALARLRMLIPAAAAEAAVLVRTARVVKKVVVDFVALLQDKITRKRGEKVKEEAA